MISFLLESPFSSRYFLIINKPVNSPEAPAGGWNVALSIPVISIKNFSSSWSISKLPCVKAAGVAG